MRRWSAPLSVTLPPPSSTTTRDVLTTLAVSVITIVCGSAPQLNVMTPPRATASTTAREVQLAGVPLPITRSGCEVSTSRASGGSATPFGFPGGTDADNRRATAVADAAPVDPGGRRARAGHERATIAPTINMAAVVVRNRRDVITHPFSPNLRRSREHTASQQRSLSRVRPRAGARSVRAGRRHARSRVGWRVCYTGGGPDERRHHETARVSLLHRQLQGGDDSISGDLRRRVERHGVRRHAARRGGSSGASTRTW